jgi:hypothetical protein
MDRDYFQEEETYLFSSVVSHLRKASPTSLSVTNKCFLAVFWKLYENLDMYREILEDIEREIEQYDPDPSRESSRTLKVFVCVVYNLLIDTPKYATKVRDYLLYARDTGDWLGQPRIACGIALFRDNAFEAEAHNYLKEKFSSWLPAGRDEFIAVSLIALRDEVTSGDLQKTCEHISSAIDKISLQLRSLYLIGVSICQTDSPDKRSTIDSLYRSISNDLRVTPLSEIDIEVLGAVAVALLLSQYHKVTGYFERYSEELKTTLALKNDLVKKDAFFRNRFFVLCIVLIFCIVLINLIFFLPSWIEFPKDPSQFEQLLILMNKQRWWALTISGGLIISIVYSYKKTGDPMPAIIELMRNKIHLSKSTEKE